MWYTILITLVMDIAGLLLIYAVVSDRVRRATNAASQIAALRDEVSRLVVELNQTTERNVALVEDRIASLNELAIAADKKIGLLKREIEKHDVGARIYSRLAEERQVSAGGRPGSPSAGQTGAAGAAGTPPLSVELSEKPRRDDEMRGVPRRDDERQELRQCVMMLHRSGFPASLIANRVGMPAGEVELIISLEQRKGEG
jgi:uncharacterized small protein (DUF1192 family)